MTDFLSANPDAYSVSTTEGAKGPRLGFLDAFDAAWQEQTRVNSLLGLERGFRDAEQAQIRKMREAGMEPHKSLDDIEEDGRGPLLPNRYTAVAKSLSGEGGFYMDEYVKQRDDYIKQKQSERPDLGLQTYGEMFKGLQEQAQEITRRASLSTTAGGVAGEIAGTLAGGMNPLTDPISFATLGVGGGATIPARMAIQGVASGIAETANIGLSNNRELLLGTPESIAHKIGRVGLATVGGAGAQGVIEGAGAVGRRLFTGKWFNDIEPSKFGPPIFSKEPTSVVERRMFEELQPGARIPADRPLTDYASFEQFARSQGYNLENPYGTSRLAEARHADDILYVGRELNRWDGPAAHEIAARTETTLPSDVEPGVRYDNPLQRYVDRLETVEDVARRLDPDLFATYDRLAGKVDELRAAIDRVQTLPDTRRDAARPDRIAEHAAWKQQREVELRQELQQVDYQMRDMAPLVSRATGAAERVWRSTPIDFATINFLKKLENKTGWRYRGEGQLSLTEQPLRPKGGPDPLPPRTLNETVPLSRLSPELEAKVRPGADAADRVAIHVDAAQSALTEQIDTVLKTVKKTVTMDGNELRAAVTAAQEKLAAALKADGLRSGQALVVARQLPDGTIVKGEPGQIHAELLNDADLAAYLKGGLDIPDLDAQMGFSPRDATGFLTRKEALDFVRAHEPDVKPSGAGSRYGLEASYYKEAALAAGKTAGPSDAARAAKQELDELTGINLPDGSRLEYDEKMLNPFDANGGEITVRDYLREMHADSDAMSAVVTCSRPS